MQIDRIVKEKKKKFIISYYYLLVYKNEKKNYVFKNDKAKKNGWHDMNTTTLLPHYYPTLKRVRYNHQNAFWVIQKK